MAEFCATCLRRHGAEGCARAAGDPQVFRPAVPPPGYPAEIPPQAPPRFRSGQHTTARALVIAAVVLVVVAAAVTTGVLVTVDRTPAAGPYTSGAVGMAPGGRLSATAAPLAVTDAPAAITSATAGCVSGPGTDAAGNPFTYEASNAVDQRPETAWRCDGNGVGASLLLTFSEPAVISWIGVVPGFAKTDPYDGTDRYLQGRRVSVARFVFDDGTYVEHGFDTWTTSRTMQVVRFPPTATGHLELIVLASVPGSPTNGFGPTDKIAVSELAVGR
jgi:hypothetical protein